MPTSRDMGSLENRRFEASTVLPPARESFRVIQEGLTALANACHNSSPRSIPRHGQVPLPLFVRYLALRERLIRWISSGGSYDLPEGQLGVGRNGVLLGTDIETRRRVRNHFHVASPHVEHLSEAETTPVDDRGDSVFRPLGLSQNRLRHP
ncbi:hypothetical protein LshimejAT787_2500320 [Lyophyllum shimeji]|uniref:Uncharacterized protein n=1 Tax=Lyophyllum shimeji TaxID=47721 RepID=A0A9P3UV94_LYOSH|nr:hypothetical protein LshimejAT787_2500110 [Lyophyllum shimeji]GLB45640.1 hypothetical protein LshimejAT787_2500320 [Lyophyllum shimeji]